MIVILNITDTPRRHDPVPVAGTFASKSSRTAFFEAQQSIVIAIKAPVVVMTPQLPSDQKSKSVFQRPAPKRSKLLSP